MAIESTNLHRRLALNILRITGSEMRWLLAGVMITSGKYHIVIRNSPGVFSTHNSGICVHECHEDAFQALLVTNDHH